MTTTDLSRRDFLKSASLAGAGLLIGFTLPGDSLARVFAGVPETGFSPNAWLSIDTTGGVTIWVGKSEMGQGVHTALPMIVADELEVDWKQVRIEQAYADKKFGRMGTGGSTSVRTSWDSLRAAGAAGREMLIAAAAQRWGVATATCRAELGTVRHTPTDRTLSYGELALAASKLPVPSHPALKDPKAFRYIGKKMLRADSPEKVNGKALFGIDVRIPGMLYAVIARPAVFGGKVRSFDPKRALAVGGVKKVLEVESGVAVFADSTWNALQGRDALDITWDNGPNSTMSSASITAMLNEFSQKPGAVAESEGDAQKALASSARTIEARYEAPFLAHATMEPMNATADVRKDRCEIWAPTQNPQGNRSDAAKITGLSEDAITVHVTFLGGGFGRRYFPDFIHDAVMCSKAAGTPVKVTWTREDDMRHDWYRPPSVHLLRGGLNADGSLAALTHKITAPSINGQMNPSSIKDGLDKGAVEGAAELPYHIPALRVDYVMANTGVPAGYWRSVYPSQNVFALESFLDELAEAARKDPFDFRLALADTSPRLKNVLMLAREKSGWDTPPSPGRFRGMAVSPPAFFQTYVAQVVELSVTPDNAVHVHRVVCVVDCGQAVNPLTIEAQIQGGMVYGLTAALMGEITITGGAVEQGSFDDYPLLTIGGMPKVDVHIVPSTEPPSGTGEPGLPATAPAVGNALYRATGKRFRSLPFRLA